MKKKLKAPKLPIASTRTPSLKVDTSSTVSPWKSIPIDRPFPLPPPVKDALQRLSEAGYIAYVVGGSVRDFLLGKDSKDHDIATSADPDELCRIFPEAITVGKAFGVVKVPTGGSPPLLEIATFRKDLDYTDHRHPEGVIFADAYEDSLRRDFTVNALFLEPKTRRILDATGGLEDLREKLIRAIGDPNERFREDALRLLRAVRFQANLGFRLHPDTEQAIRARAKLVSKVSLERVRDELTLMFTGPRPADALRTLSDLGLLPLVLPEVEAVRLEGKAVWGRLLKMLDVLARKNPRRSVTLSWMAVLHEVGKPIALKMNAGKNFNGHEIEGARIAKAITQRLKMSRQESDRISAMVGAQLKFKEAFQMRESTLQRFIRQEFFEDLLIFHEADAISSDGNLAYYEFCNSRYQTMKQTSSGESQKLIDGTDLIQLGFQPGPEFSQILNVVEDLTLEKKLHSKEEALEFVIKSFVK